MTIRRSVLGLTAALVLLLSLPLALLVGPKRLREYAYRELAYRVIADEATKNATDEVQVIKSLFEYVSEHEHKANANVLDLPAFDSLVRGIAWCDQQAWTFATLLAKKGIPGSMLMLRGYDAESHHTIASVYVSGQWRMMDPFYTLLFFQPSGEIATFEDLQRPERRAQLTSPTRDAIERYNPGFSDGYSKLFESRYPPIQWQPLTEKKRDVGRLAVSRVLDAYVTVFGRGFAHRFQDAYLLLHFGHTRDSDLFFRARHYDLFFRQDLALAAYDQLLADYPDSSYTQDAMYFLAKLDEDRCEWTKVRDTSRALLERFGENCKWAGMAHYLNGVASEAQGDVSNAIDEYEASAPSTDQQVDWSGRLLALGVPPR